MVASFSVRATATTHFTCFPPHPSFPFSGQPFQMTLHQLRQPQITLPSPSQSASIQTSQLAERCREKSTKTASSSMQQNTTVTQLHLVWLLPPSPSPSSFPDAGLKLNICLPVSAHLHTLCGRGTSARPRCPRKKGTRIRRVRTSTAGFLWAGKSAPPSGVLLTGRRTYAYPLLCVQATCGPLAGLLLVDAALHLHVCALLRHNSNFLPAGAVRTQPWFARFVVQPKIRPVNKFLSCMCF